jgi:hypothetical protein
MKKSILLLMFLLLIISISYGAYHKPGADLYISATQSTRTESTGTVTGATGNVNTTFYVMADAYTSYEYPNPAGYGDQMGIAKIYWPNMSSENNVVQSVKASTGLQSDGVTEDYDVHTILPYTGWVSHYSYYVIVGTPLNYVASANAYIEWTD